MRVSKEPLTTVECVLGEYRIVTQDGQYGETVTEFWDAVLQGTPGVILASAADKETTVGMARKICTEAGKTDGKLTLRHIRVKYEEDDIVREITSETSVAVVAA